LKNMQNIRKKTPATMALLLIAVFVVSSVATLPTTTSDTTYKTKTTYAVCGLMPNPVGVNQEVLVWIGITDYLENEAQSWKGLTVSVTKPDGKNETLGPYDTDSTGSTGAVYVPDQVGNYTFQTHFPAQWYNWTSTSTFDSSISGNIWYKASDSETVTLVVTEEPAPSYPYTALPSEYWTRPINAQHYTWNTISANWLSTPVNLDAVGNDFAPKSSHILWTKPLVLGGLSGGFNDNHGHETGDAYEGKFSSSVILDGRLYYNRYASGFGGGWVQQGIICVDLRTGEEVWFKNNSRLAFGQTLYWDAWNMHGVFSYIYTSTSVTNWATYTTITTWNAYDPLTGEYQFSINNIPSTGAMFGASTLQTGPNGEFIIYNIDLAHGWVAKWNSTTAVIGLHPSGDMSGGSWGSAANTQQTFNGTRGYDWNKTLAAGAGNLPGGISAVLEDRVIGSTAGNWAGMGDNPISLWSFSLDSTTTTLPTLFNTTWTPPKGDLTVSFGESSLADKVFTLGIKEKRIIYGFNLDTGKLLWGPTDPQTQLQIYGMSGCIVDGRLFSTGYGGIVYCYNVTNGNPLWTYEAKDPYNEILWSTNWPLQVCFVAADKIYLSHSEHSPVNPLPRGAPFVCLDVTNGEKLWDIPLRGTSWGGNGIIGDSIIATWNSYDGQVYAVGKGESATTVTGPDLGIPAGSSAIIRGTVTDQSTGAKDTPAIADESMDEWMKYLYMQFDKPLNATGVPVSIDAIDPNGNFLHIGDTTSDISGTYSYRWEPPSEIPGKYTLIASFAGSDSYWPSTATTAVSVDPAEEPTPAPTQAEPSMADTYLVPMGTAIIVVIIVVGAALALMMRRRP
jgi:outer membrane protein assembly factor BamB